MTTGANTDTVSAGAVNAICEGRHGNPFDVLGPHPAGEGLIVRAFQPGADEARLVDPESGDTITAMTSLDPRGLFSAELPRPRAYRLAFRQGTHEWEIEDAYRFGLILGSLDAHLLAEGSHLRLWERLGAHPTSMDGVDGVAFAVWAPSAQSVSVVGSFNGWDDRRHPMRLRRECGVWELFIPHLQPGDLYKYSVLGPSGDRQPLKADPVGFAAQHPPATASVVHGLVRHAWEDEGWMATRQKANALDAPISVYEVHLGSWMRKGDGNGYLSYDELVERLIPYAKDMGFTHLELMPVSEYPFDGSWGYQPVGLFAPTSRFGDPAGFARFMDACHKAGLGVMLDWVPGHFPTDAHGLARFDGSALYEHADPRQGFHQDWNTLIYNYGRREVQNFLLANALFWLDRYHIDALRVDAVASMLYLDYSRSADAWVPNRYGGRENLDAIDLLRRMNSEAFGNYPGSTTVAEESTAWPGVSRPVYAGGLGFGYKWNMGWMHDTLSFMSNDPIHRRYHHHEMTFGLLYAFSENFILPLSHDEVVHGKGSLINKMPGDRWQKFANLRAYMGFMWGHPGKKLLFMGGEFAQEREWNHDHSLDWHLLDDPHHRGQQRLIRDLNTLYCETPALHEKDCDPEGFEWIEASDAEQSVIAFLRRGRTPDDIVVVVCNFTPIPRHDFRIGVPLPGRYHECINTDAELYGGSGVGNHGGVDAADIEAQGRPFSLNLTLPPLSTLIFERRQS